MVVQTLAARNGLYADFGPKPLKEKCGNGYHIDIAPIKIGKEVTDESVADSFMAGILARIREISAFLNPAAESYHRIGTYKAPKYITWAPDNRTQLMRVIPFDGKYKRVELRSPDSLANPYLALALIIHAGLDGIEHNTQLTPAFDGNTDKLDTLPLSLEEALKCAAGSEFVSRHIPERILKEYSL